MHLKINESGTKPPGINGTMWRRHLAYLLSFEYHDIDDDGFNILGFPGGISGKEPSCQCRRHKRHRFDLWVRKIPWRRKWQPTPVCLTWTITWTEEPGGLQSRGLQRVRHDWVLKYKFLKNLCSGDEIMKISVLNPHTWLMFTWYGQIENYFSQEYFL